MAICKQCGKEAPVLESGICEQCTAESQKKAEFYSPYNEYGEDEDEYGDEDEDFEDGSDFL